MALDIKTGERQWHYQLTHHDIWDWDIPSAPVISDLPNGQKVLMSVTKQSWIYTFDRATGEPIWPIEERPVPAGDVPGEWYSPTQPFPTNPPPFDRQGFTEKDLIDWTPEIRALALDATEGFRLAPSVYSPPSLADAEDGTRGTLSLPSATGGANWEGAAIDPETGVVTVLRYLAVDDVGTVMNPLLLKGQLHGGIVQGIAQILGERIVMDESGQVLTGSFMDYHMPRADEYPSFEIESHIVPSPRNPLGIKGAGEAGTVGAVACLASAIHDALAPLGISSIDFPATPERIWQAVKAA